MINTKAIRKKIVRRIKLFNIVIILTLLFIPISILLIYVFTGYDIQSKLFHSLILFVLIFLPIINLIFYMYRTVYERKLILYRDVLIKTKMLMKYEKALVLIKNNNIEKVIDMYNDLPNDSIYKELVFILITIELRRSIDNELRLKGEKFLNLLIKKNSSTDFFNNSMKNIKI